VETMRWLCPIAASCFALLLSANLAAQKVETQPQTSPAKIRVEVNVLLVPVVAIDKQGHAVGDLQKEDFQVFDHGQLQKISGFTVEKRTPITDGNSASVNPQGLTPGGPPLDPSHTSGQRFIVFLFDDLHLSVVDLAQVQRAAAHLLVGSLSNSDSAAVVSTSGTTNSGLTRDRAKLQDAIMQLKSRSRQRSDCPNINDYQADLIENHNDPEALQDAIDQMLACQPNTPLGMARAQAQLAAKVVLRAGEQDVQDTLAVLEAVVGRMATLQGQRNLIVVSPGFPTGTVAAARAQSHIIDLATQSEVTISALDPRGVYITEATASDDTRGRSPLAIAELRRRSMQADTNPMVELTDGTGGTFFHNNNDLEAGIRRLTKAPENVYVLQISLDNIKQDGAYHQLRVKVNRPGLQLTARRGYFAPKADGATAQMPAAAPIPESLATQETPAVKPELSPAQQSSTSPPAAVTPQPSSNQKDAGTAGKLNNQTLFWFPLDVDSPLRSVSSSPCLLSNVLEQAGQRANEMVTNLQNFTAQEKIEYRLLENGGDSLRTGAGTFDYTVAFQQRQEGLAVQETRTPERGSQAFPAIAQDVGLPEMALIFLPAFQADYEMRCEGVVDWNGRRTSVIHFKQRSDRPIHTASFNVKGVAYPAKLKGRAWIVQDSSPDSGEVIHMETSVMESIPAANVLHMYLSIDYGPVQFRTQNSRLWLPKAVDANGDFGDHRTAVHHSFTDFLLYFVRIDQSIEKPKGS
jgi:VWFA-related protein